VGFDPRGVGRSTAVNCGTDAELDDYFLTDGVITTEAELTAAVERTADFAKQCKELTGSLIEYVDTASAVRDMDVIRVVVGDEKLNFLGFSYGTQLGAVYATLFPENVGRMVLDGAVDFLLPSEETSLGQVRGFERALDAYITDCLTIEDCPLPPDPELAKHAIREMLDTARNEGIPTYRGDINGTVLLYGVFVPLYSGTGGWPILTEALDEYLNLGTAREFLYLADTYYLLRDEDGRYLGNQSEANLAISCLDTPPSSPESIAEFREFQRVAEEESPTFGWWFGSFTGCEGWPWTADEIVDDLTPTASAPPIVIIGTTGDPATPVEWAESLAEKMPTSTLVIYTGEGHTAYLYNPGTCIVDAVDSYFIDGTVPATGLTC
jgi:pimeloyl-ACP methyl ester carboxylesterase